MENIVAQESRLVLHNVGWDTYECLLRDLKDSSAPRLTYDRGTLEIMSPTFRHEKRNRRLARLVEVLTEAWEIPIEHGGSMPLRRPTLGRGFEPDSCFYVQNAALMATRDEVDLEGGDPPPDLVLEIDVTSPSLEKLPLYAQIGVPEVWRHSGADVTIYVLDGEAYETSRFSRALPLVRSDALTDFMDLGDRLPLLEWLNYVREWAEAQTTPPSATIQ